jgi:hypothetical protein
MRRSRSWLLGVVALGLLLSGIAAAANRDDGSEPENPRPRVTAAAQERADFLAGLDTGECIPQGALDNDRNLLSPVTVACSRPHELEVAAAFGSGHRRFPGDAELAGEARAKCIAAIAKYVGAPFERIGADRLDLTPTSASWRAGGHRIVCLIDTPSAISQPLADAGLAAAVVTKGLIGGAELVPGDCLPSPSDPASRQVRLIACAEGHQYELYAKQELEDVSFPGQEALETRTNKFCAEAFEPYIGHPYAESSFQVVVLYPKEDNWKRGEREISCFLEFDKPSEGSAKGTRG